MKFVFKSEMQFKFLNFCVLLRLIIIPCFRVQSEKDTQWVPVHAASNDIYDGMCFGRCNPRTTTIEVVAPNRHPVSSLLVSLWEICCLRRSG